MRPNVGTRPGEALAAPSVPPTGTRQYLRSDETWGSPPGAPFVDLGRTFSGDNSTTPEASLLNTLASNSGNNNNAAASIFAAGVTVGDFWDLSLRGTLFNNTGTGTLTSRLRVYFGSLAIFDQTSAAIASANLLRQWGADLHVVVETVGGASSGTLRVSARQWGLTSIYSTGAFAATTGEQTQNAISTGAQASLITNAAQNFNVTALHSGSGANLQTTLSECLLRYYKLG